MKYKIDYTGIQIPDIESIKRTSQQFTDWVSDYPLLSYGSRKR